MAKLPRKTVVQFGAGGPSTDFGQFGSEKAGTPQTTQDPSVIQQLAAWATGWAAAAVGAAFNPYLEDLNGFCFTVFYFIANLFERGIPDYDAGTTYYKGAYVQDPAGSGQRWYSLQDNNLNNAPPASASNAFWQWDNAPQVPVGTMLDFAGLLVPTGYLALDGSQKSRTTFSGLFSALSLQLAGNLTGGLPQITGLASTSNLQPGFPISGPGVPTGATILSVDSGSQVTMTLNALSTQVGVNMVFAPWGVGDGSTTFTLPDSRRRVAVGAGGVGTSTLGSRIGATGGEETHTLTIAEMPAHTHTYNQTLLNFTKANGSDAVGGSSSSVNSGSTGGDGAHNNIQPSYVVTKIIKT